MSQLLQCTQYELTQISICNYEQYKETERKIIHDLQSKKGRSGNMKVTQGKEKKIDSNATMNPQQHYVIMYRLYLIEKSSFKYWKCYWTTARKNLNKICLARQIAVQMQRWCSAKTKHTTMVQRSVSHKTVKLTDTWQMSKKEWKSVKI